MSQLSEKKTDNSACVSPNSIDDLLTTYLQHSVNVPPEQDLRHLIPKFKEEGITKTVQLLQLTKQDRSNLMKKLNLTKPEKVLVSGALQQLESHATFWGESSSNPSSPLSPNKPISIKETKSKTTSQQKNKWYVGIINQGATCYLNSVLQALFHISEFRRAVYCITTEEAEDASKSIPLALQRLFYDLEFNSSPASTKVLTASFGWTQEESFIQHDVQELLRKLSDNLSNKMKGTPAEGSMERLFCGRVVSYVKCITMDYKSIREEEFYDIQLTVRGCKDIYDSFKEYTVVETLDGKNKYAVEKDGQVNYVDAQKGVWFKKLPPVLMVHLRRFEYNVNTELICKVHDYYEYYDEIDLSPFLIAEDDPILRPSETSSDNQDTNGGSTNDVTEEQRTATPSPKNTPTDMKSNGSSLSFTQNANNSKYILNGVLVHSGGSFGGHYYAYIRPNNGKKWVKFNDTQVHEVSRKDVMQSNFGQQEGLNVSTTAYMLIYIRKTSVDQILYEVTEDMQPIHLKERMQKDLANAQAALQLKEQERRQIQIKLWTESLMGKRSRDNPLYPWERQDFEGSIFVGKDSTLSELQHIISDRHCIPIPHQRLWVVLPYRFELVYIDLKRSDNKLRDIFQLSRANEAMEKVHLFIQEYEIPYDENNDEDEMMRKNITVDIDPQYTVDRRSIWVSMFTSRPQPAILLLVNFYNPAEKTARFLGCHTVFANTTASKLFEVIIHELHLPADLKLIIYTSELLDSRSQYLEEHESFSQIRINSGDLVWVQPQLTKEKQQEYEIPTVKKYMEYLKLRRYVTFVRLDYAATYLQKRTSISQTDKSNPSFNSSASHNTTTSANNKQELGEDNSVVVTSMYLQLNDTYSQIQKKLGAAVDSSPEHIRLWDHQSGSRGGPLPKPETTCDKWGKELQLHNLTSQTYSQRSNKILMYWDVLDIPVKDHEACVTITVEGMDVNVRYIGTRSVFIRSDAPMKDLLKMVHLEFQKNDEGTELDEHPMGEYECWLVLINPLYNEIRFTFGHDCTGDVFQERESSGTVQDVLEQLKKGYNQTLRYEPKPRLRINKDGILFSNQKWVQVLHFEYMDDGERPTGSRKLKMHWNPFFIYVGSEDTGQTLMAWINENISPPPPIKKSNKSSSNISESAIETPTTTQTQDTTPTWKLHALVYSYQYWYTKLIEDEDNVHEKLKAFRVEKPRSCLGLMHPFIDQRKQENKKNWLYGGGPELKIND